MKFNINVGCILSYMLTCFEILNKEINDLYKKYIFKVKIFTSRYEIKMFINIFVNLKSIRVGLFG